MKILLINIDSRYPNLALLRLEKYYGKENCEWKRFTQYRRVREYTPRIINKIVGDPSSYMRNYDKVFISCTFTHNKVLADQFKKYENCLIGGTGYDYTVTLPDEVASIRPKINMDFTTRGCIRKCDFCLVWRSEGNIKITGDLLDVWDGYRGVAAVLDNNILAAPEHFEKIAWQSKKYGVAIDFNQGLDIRLITPKICRLIKMMPAYKNLKFAYDDIRLSEIVHEKVDLLRSFGIRTQLFFYVLVGYNTTIPDDLRRVYELKELKCRAYIMRYGDVYFNREYMLLADYCNGIRGMGSASFEEYKKRWKTEKPLPSFRRKYKTSRLDRQLKSTSYPFGYEVVQ